MIDKKGEKVLVKKKRKQSSEIKGTAKTMNTKLRKGVKATTKKENQSETESKEIHMERI